MADPYAVGGTYVTDLGDGRGSVTMHRRPDAVGQVTTAFRHTYAWNNFWTHTVGLTLTTHDILPAG